MFSFVYIRVLCFNVSAQNNQIALVIIQPIRNSHFWRSIFIFVVRQNVDQRYNNNNKHEDIYSAVIMVEPLREFTRFTR